MKIEILGTGCAKCNTLTENARIAVERLGLTNCAIVKVQDLKEIARRGVVVTPAILIDGKPKAVGRVASPEEIEGWLREAMVAASES